MVPTPAIGDEHSLRWSKHDGMVGFLLQRFKVDQLGNRFRNGSRQLASTQVTNVGREDPLASKDQTWICHAKISVPECHVGKVANCFRNGTSELIVVHRSGYKYEDQTIGDLISSRTNIELGSDEQLLPEWILWNRCFPIPWGKVSMIKLVLFDPILFSSSDLQSTKVGEATNRFRDRSCQLVGRHRSGDQKSKWVQ